MFGLFHRKPKEPKRITLGRAVVVIKTLTADEYRVPIKGRSLFDDWKTSVFGEYDIQYRQTRHQFVDIGDGKSIPVCNIKEMYLDEIQPNYSEEIL